MSRHIPRRPGRQQGIVAVFTVIAMTALLGMGALALDVGNMVLTKGKLQSLADAAALSAATAIDQKQTQADATLAGRETITVNLASTAYDGIDVANAVITFEYSLEPDPFVPTTDEDASYVRVRILEADTPDFLARIFNTDHEGAATAVAGPSTSVLDSCNIVPLSVCQGPDGIEDYRNATELDDLTGYPDGEVLVLKSTKNNEEMGEANFSPVSMDGAGAAEYREGLAGNFEGCNGLDLGADASNPLVTTEPGNMVGPTIQGLDTRFFRYFGPMSDADYPSDLVIDYEYGGDDNKVFVRINPDESFVAVDQNNCLINESDITAAAAEGATFEDCATPPDRSVAANQNYYNYATYESDASAHAGCISNGDGGYLNCKANRRMVVIPVLDCDHPTGPFNGRSDIPLVGFACFFLIQPSSDTDTFPASGGGGNNSWIVGEFREDCGVLSGEGGFEPFQFGPYKIVLYRDLASTDS